MRPRFLPIALLTAALLTGCGSKAPALRYVSDNKSTTLTQRYPIAAMSRDANGDFDLVLVSQGLESLRKTRPGADLTPTEIPPIRQVVHMKLHWRPSRGAKANNPAAANATVRWLIFSPPTVAPLEDKAPPSDYVEYQGTAFVRPFLEREGYTVLVREGSLDPTLIEGNMTDPLGPSTFEGKFYVRDDAATVRNLLKELPPSTPAAAPKATTRPTPATRPTTRRR